MLRQDDEMIALGSIPVDHCDHDLLAQTLDLIDEELQFEVPEIGYLAPSPDPFSTISIFQAEQMKSASSPAGTPVIHSWNIVASSQAQPNVALQKQPPENAYRTRFTLFKGENDKQEYRQAALASYRAKKAGGRISMVFALPKRVTGRERGTKGKFVSNCGSGTQDVSTVTFKK
jgi:hypothetical protein